MLAFNVMQMKNGDDIVLKIYINDGVFELDWGTVRFGIASGALFIYLFKSFSMMRR